MPALFHLRPRHWCGWFLVTTLNEQRILKAVFQGQSFQRYSGTRKRAGGVNACFKEELRFFFGSQVAAGSSIAVAERGDIRL